MALLFHSDDVDEFLSLSEAVRIAEDGLRNLTERQGVNAPRKRLNLRRQFAEASFDTVLNIYAGGSASYGALDQPRREIDDGTLKRCSFIVALSKEQAIDSQQGDIYWPVQNGVMGWEKVVEITDILAGKAPGRTDDKQIILYKNQVS